MLPRRNCNSAIAACVFLVHAMAATQQPSPPPPGDRCDPDKLTVYRIHLRTSWSRDMFPKHYPEWRPPAQWSTLIGRSHNHSYALFHLNEVASEGMKAFAEGSSANILGEKSQGGGGIFDEFNAPPITQGVGEAESEFFVDGNHSLVSMASRVVPSPDWFIGIDSFDLCVEGKWMDSVVLELDPLDAGTDNGYTFTSPNWRTTPPKPVSRITARKPDHPAHSFFYEDRLEHPPIATVAIFKVKEYELSRVFNLPPPPQVNQREVYKTSSEPLPPVEKSLKGANEVLPFQGDSSAAPTFAKDTNHHVLLTNLVKTYKKKFRKNKKRGRKAQHRLRKPRNCRVSEWGEWSSCSKTCGIGEQTRERKVLKPSRRRGRPCPLLTEQKWCGSSRDCDHKYFDW